jgi:glycosyltransferase involved in cell wall biosynthesis
VRVSVGIDVHTAPDRLARTLRALDHAGRFRMELLLLPDGPDSSTRAALATLDLPQSGSDHPLGRSACFNRLAAETDSDVVILLESGAIPAFGALERLVEVIASDPRNGIAGPSTNQAWNEQLILPRTTAADADIARAGKQAVRQFGSKTRSLAPLHSLSDFCYAVRREVIEAIGGADEGYGLGPCWEMEYSARAARAGFRGLWVCGAYVYRAPFTERRRLDEARAFEPSRRRYQDSLCALRLRGERAAYEPHCRGEECQHFAPAGLIQLRRPLPVRAPGFEAGRAAAGRDVSISPRPELPLQVRPVTPPCTERPLVTCVMPTRDRAEFALHAVELFRRQDYEPRELIVVDDGGDDLGARLPADPRIRHLRVPAGESIGAKRNRACAEARGTLIAQWDDDDWYGPRRLSIQLEPLIAGRADLTGLRARVFFELESWRFWTITEALHRRLFVGDVHGGTLAFNRPVWERLAQYPSRSLAEDAVFLARATARGARLERIDGEGLFVYLRHRRNAWRFNCGDYLDSRGWAEVPEPPFAAEDRSFYAAHSLNAPALQGMPLVSCIMPTADRRRFIQRAIAYFRRQDYANRELVVLDDGDDRVEDLIPPDPRIRYVALDGRLVLGEKRNRACELARGELIVHWDDDDWQAPHRLRYEAEALERSGAGLCGPSKALYFDPEARRAWLYAYPDGRRHWVAGNALCYRRSLWEENRFASVAVGEDTRFVWDPRAGKPLVLPDHRFFAALIHPGNSSPKTTQGTYWQPRPLDEVHSLLGSDWVRYQP